MAIGHDPTPDPEAPPATPAGLHLLRSTNRSLPAHGSHPDEVPGVRGGAPRRDPSLPADAWGPTARVRLLDRGNGVIYSLPANGPTPTRLERPKPPPSSSESVRAGVRGHRDATARVRGGLVRLCSARGPRPLRSCGGTLPRTVHLLSTRTVDSWTTDGPMWGIWWITSLTAHRPARMVGLARRGRRRNDEAPSLLWCQPRRVEVAEIASRHRELAEASGDHINAVGSTGRSLRALPCLTVGPPRAAGQGDAPEGCDRHPGVDTSSGRRSHRGRFYTPADVCRRPL
jgi:hypothetical protein